MSWTIGREKILTAGEITKCLTTLRRLEARGPHERCALALFRLTVGCGLRASEACGLEMRDVRTDSEAPHLIVRSALAKNGKARTVPLDWDAGTLRDIAAWEKSRLDEGARPYSPFLIVTRPPHYGRRLNRQTARRRWVTIVRRALGQARAARATIHHGRHSAATHYLAAGYSPAEVRDMLGHSSLAVTDVYVAAVAALGRQPKAVFLESPAPTPPARAV